MTYISMWLKNGESVMIHEDQCADIEKAIKASHEYPLTLKFAFHNTYLAIRNTEIQGYCISTPEMREACREYNKVILAEEPSFE